MVSMQSKRSRQIPLKAVVDPDVTEVHWFVDQAYVGSASAGNTLLWDSHPGYFEVLAVDDSGRSAHKAIRVMQQR